MKTIGLLGGMSWHSTADYYRIINEQIATRRGGHHSAQIVMVSLDFEEIRDLQRRDAWDEAGACLVAAGTRLQEAGADLIVLCTNLMHKVAGDLETGLQTPLLHIADAVGNRLTTEGHRTVGLLGTRPVMEETFYRDRLRQQHGVEVLTPDRIGRELVDRVIFDELTVGTINEASRAAYIDIIDGLAAQGAEAIVLGCTEIELLITDTDSPIPVVDSTHTHAVAAAEAALAT